MKKTKKVKKLPGVKRAKHPVRKRKLIGPGVEHEMMKSK
jgi:hypothetical protein